jgi:flagellar basal body rod protein FlgC
MTDTAFDIAATGMAAERTAMDVIAQNLATGGTAGRVPRESSAAETAFVPASFSSALDDALSIGDSPDVGMPLGGDLQSASTFSDAEVELGVGDDSPALPAAAAAGSDPIGQMIALVATGRAYDADVAALQAAKQMDVEASDIDKF